MAVGAYFAWLPHDQIIYNSGCESIPEAASLTIKRGTPVIKDANGRVDAAGASPALIYGVAAEDGHNGTAGQYELLVWPLRVNQKWRICLLEALAQNLLGLAAGDCGIVKDATTGFWYASTADGGAQCRIVDYVKGPAGFTIGDTKAAGIFHFHSTKLQVV